MNGSRYHAEIKLNYAGREVRINIFADTLIEVFQDLGNITAQMPEFSAAQRELRNAENLAAARQPTTPAPQPKPAAKPASRSVPIVPACAKCGSPDNMERIEWADKATGAPRQAWKCQQCSEWHRPNGKKA